MYIKGEGLAVNLKTKVAVQFVDQHERTLVIRDTKSQGHRGMTNSRVHACCHIPANGMDCCTAAFLFWNPSFLRVCACRIVAASQSTTP